MVFGFFFQRIKLISWSHIFSLFFFRFFSTVYCLIFYCFANSQVILFRFILILPQNSLLSGGVSTIRRGRPRTATKKTTKSYNVDEILSGPSYPLELVTTKLGGMKAAFKDYCFESHFNRLGNKFWRCTAHKDGCGAKIMSQGNVVYAVDVQHNHVNNTRFVSTSDLISSGTIMAPVQASPPPPPLPAPEPLAMTAFALQSKVKERFAALKFKQK